MDSRVMPCRAQHNKCVQLFKAICIDRVSKPVKITKTFHKQGGHDVDISGAGYSSTKYPRDNQQCLVAK
eukprot:6191401-Pleurochrysis_carterae.AAC.1